MTPFTKTTTKTYAPLWVRENFSVFNEVWVKARVPFPYKGNECFKCDRPFKDGDAIALACLGNVGNKVFCAECAKELSK